MRREEVLMYLNKYRNGKNIPKDIMDKKIYNAETQDGGIALLLNDKSLDCYFNNTENQPKTVIESLITYAFRDNMLTDVIKKNIANIIIDNFFKAISSKDFKNNVSSVPADCYYYENNIIFMENIIKEKIDAVIIEQICIRFAKNNFNIVDILKSCYYITTSIVSCVVNAYIDELFIEYDGDGDPLMYLSEKDYSLEKSLALAYELDYSLTEIDAKLLATLMYTKNIKKVISRIDLSMFMYDDIVKYLTSEIDTDVVAVKNDINTNDNPNICIDIDIDIVDIINNLKKEIENEENIFKEVDGSVRFISHKYRLATNGFKSVYSCASNIMRLDFINESNIRDLRENYNKSFNKSYNDIYYGGTLL